MSTPRALAWSLPLVLTVALVGQAAPLPAAAAVVPAPPKAERTASVPGRNARGG